MTASSSSSAEPLAIASGSGVGGGSLGYANTLYRAPARFYEDPQWAGLDDWQRVLAPHYDEAERMLGVATYDEDDPADDYLREYAEVTGVGETYAKTRVGVFLGEPGVTVPDPFFGGEGPERTGCMRCGRCMVGCPHGAKNTLAVAMACACAGIVIGCVTITGLGIVFTQMVVALAQDSLILALMLTAVAGIILGMGMPTTPAYIMMVALLVPAVIKLGAVTPAAHMFAFYFAILSAITPPVALAVFAAAGLAKADLWSSGWAAVKIGCAGFIVPFMFVYEPALLMIGEWPRIIQAFVTAGIGITLFAGGLHGYFLTTASPWQRVLLLGGGLLLIDPNWITDVIGAVIAAIVIGVQFLSRQAQREAAKAASYPATEPS